MPKPVGHLEGVMREIGELIGQALKPKKAGFVLVVFDWGADGSMSYISNGQREDCIKMLGELQEKLKQEVS